LLPLTRQAVQAAGLGLDLPPPAQASAA
jgi:hypothetical protein